MSTMRNFFRRFKGLNNAFAPASRLLRGLPAVTEAAITHAEIRELVGIPDPVILEIGCNDGRDTLRFLEVFEQPRVYCFEPDPRAVKRFQHAVGDRDDVQLFELALGHKQGQTDFHMSSGNESEEWPEGWDFSGSIRRPAKHLELHPWCRFDQVITVEITTLDHWCIEQGIQQIDFIWMDVQGAEIDVIRGGSAALSKTRFLYTEYSDLELYAGQASLIELVRALEGFKIMTRYPHDILLKNKSLA